MGYRFGRLARGFAGVSVAVLASAVWVAQPVRAQVLYGSIVGTVQDRSGAVIQGAAVVLTSPATGQTRQTTTNDAGMYSLNNVLAGAYELKVTATGFRPYVQTDVAATINNVARLDVKLE